MHGHARLRAYFLGVFGLLCARQMAFGQGGGPSQFIRGDANADGEKNISDTIYMLGCNFLGTECATCLDAADVNDDGKSDITDPIYLLNFLFLGGSAPPAPSEACGADPTDDELGCGSFPRCASANPDAISTAKGDLIVKPVEHASVVLLWDGKAIYSDPVGGVAKFRGLPAPDIIVVTHTHGDHMDRATINGIAKAETVLVLPQAVSQALANQGGVGALEQRILANGEKTTVGEIEIEAVAMYNARHKKGEGNGYVITLAGARVYASGDTEDTAEMRALQNIDLAFLCMNLPFTMTPDAAASAALEFKPKVVYPYHYKNQDGTTDPNAQSFKTLVEAASQEIEVRLRDWYP